LGFPLPDPILPLLSGSSGSCRLFSLCLPLRGGLASAGHVYQAERQPRYERYGDDHSDSDPDGCRDGGDEHHGA